MKYNYEYKNLYCQIVKWQSINLKPMHTQHLNNEVVIFRQNEKCTTKTNRLKI